MCSDLSSLSIADTALAELLASGPGSEGRDLLPDHKRVLGATHPHTLRTRSNIMHRIAELL